jgi:hypothetical protein
VKEPSVLPRAKMLCPFRAGERAREHPNGVPHISPGRRPGRQGEPSNLLF